MKEATILLSTITLTLSAIAKPPMTNAPSKGTISVQEMLATGPTQLKMHSLMMMNTGQIKGDVDTSYLPGLTITAEHTDSALRSMTAQILGKKFIQDQEAPNTDALVLISQLSKDDVSDVRFNAIYYGLTQVKHKSPELAEQLIDIAAKERNPSLQDRIIISLANYQPQVEEILNEKLKSEDAISYYEIYEEFTGKEPPNAEKFLDMPSSRPHLIIIKPSDKDAEAAQSALIAALKKKGISSPSVEISGKGENAVLLVTTYITRDYKVAKDFLKDNDQYSITQDMWLTPELEIQIEAMRKASE